jgi:hypothetical protein
VWCRSIIDKRCYSALLKCRQLGRRAFHFKPFFPPALIKYRWPYYERLRAAVAEEPLLPITISETSHPDGDGSTLRSAWPSVVWASATAEGLSCIAPMAEEPLLPITISETSHPDGDEGPTAAPAPDPHADVGHLDMMDLGAMHDLS